MIRTFYSAGTPARREDKECRIPGLRDQQSQEAAFILKPVHIHVGKFSPNQVCLDLSADSFLSAPFSRRPPSPFPQCHHTPVLSRGLT